MTIERIKVARGWSLGRVSLLGRGYVPLQKNFMIFRIKTVLVVWA